MARALRLADLLYRGRETVTQPSDYCDFIERSEASRGSPRGQAVRHTGGPGGNSVISQGAHTPSRSSSCQERRRSGTASRCPRPVAPACFGHMPRRAPLRRSPEPRRARRGPCRARPSASTTWHSPPTARGWCAKAQPWHQDLRRRHAERAGRRHQPRARVEFRGCGPSICAGASQRLIGGIRDMHWTVASLAASLPRKEVRSMNALDMSKRPGA